MKNKFKTLSQGQYGESVIDKMALTFASLVGLADFSAAAARPQEPKPAPKHTPDGDAASLKATEPPPGKPDAGKQPGLSWGGLHYNIQIILPESRDPKVYDALFRSLREHL